MAGPDFKNGYKKGFEDGANSVEEGLPGWFGTFADMMTLLFAFFVLLAAISTMDPVKLQEMSNSEGKSLGSKIKSSGKAEEEGEFEPIKNLAAMKKEMEETIEEMKKENPKGDPPIDIQTSSKGLIVNIKGDYAFPIGKASMKEELKGLLDEEIIPKIAASPFQVEVAGHSDSDKMPKKWRKNFATNWELSAARGASVVRYMIDKGIPRKDYHVFDSNNNLIGKVTSGTFSPSNKLGVGMALIDFKNFKSNEIFIEQRNKRIKGLIQKVPI